MHFFVHVRSDKGFEEDRDGVEFESLDDVIADCRRAAREMVADLVLHQRHIDDRVFEIADYQGTLLATVAFKDVLGLD